MKALSSSGARPFERLVQDSSSFLLKFVITFVAFGQIVNNFTGWLPLRLFSGALNEGVQGF